LGPDPLYSELNFPLTARIISDGTVYNKNEQPPEHRAWVEADDLNAASFYRYGDTIDVQRLSSIAYVADQLRVWARRVEVVRRLVRGASARESGHHVPRHHVALGDFRRSASLGTPRVRETHELRFRPLTVRMHDVSSSALTLSKLARNLAKLAA
jgi:hypothetical protein